MNGVDDILICMYCSKYSHELSKHYKLKRIKWLYKIIEAQYHTVSFSPVAQNSG